MTPQERRLRDFAAEFASNYVSTAARLRQERDQLQLQLANLEARLNAAYRANHRLTSFQPYLGSSYACPRCWMDHEKSTHLRPHPGETRSEASWTCGDCGSQFFIPALEA
jgi:hypothetical protein